MADVAARLAGIAAAARGKRKKTVTILGAGMAGLVAGYELKRLGHRVLILEGSKRVGGRVHTHRFADGTHGELGAMRIPHHHLYTRYYVAKMGLTLRKFVTSHENLECFYDIKDTITRMKDAPAKLYPKFDLSSDQRLLPLAPDMLKEAREQLMRSLTDSEKSQVLSPRTRSERVMDLDRMTMGAFMDQRIGRGAAELVGSATGIAAWLDRSVTMFLREFVASADQGLDEIVEGMDALPTAIAKFLKHEITFDTELCGLTIRDGARARVVLRRRGIVTEHVPRGPVICALPFTVLRSLPAGFHASSNKERAVRRLGYTSSAKVLLHAADRFWEKRYGIAGGASQTDTLIGALYYPSDFVRVVRPARPTGQFADIYTGSLGGRFRSVAGPKSAGVLIGSYTWGADAQRMGALPPDARKDATIAAAARFHPEIAAPGTIDDHASIFWDETPWMRGGTFSYLEPTQQFDLVAEAARTEGNLYFAGEHCSLDNAWIQGAITSALDAVEAIVTAA